MLGCPFRLLLRDGHPSPRTRGVEGTGMDNPLSQWECSYGEHLPCMGTNINNAERCPCECHVERGRCECHFWDGAGHKADCRWAAEIIPDPEASLAASARAGERKRQLCADVYGHSKEFEMGVGFGMVDFFCMFCGKIVRSARAEELDGDEQRRAGMLAGAAFSLGGSTVFPTEEN